MVLQVPILQKQLVILVTTGKYVSDTGDGNPGRDTSDYSVANFFHFTVDTDTATKGGVSGGGIGCSVGPVSLSA